jgi:DNA (cytosine-5)-methyltransferase 1
MAVWDFFSGCGGTSAGFREAGIDVRLGLDIDHEAARTFRRNFPEAVFVESDIRAVTARSLDRHLSFGDAGEPLIFAACAPCQPFSRQNRLKHANDGRTSLLRELRRFIRRFRPDYVFVENVPGMQHGCLDGEPFQDFVAFLRGLRYAVDYAVVEALDFGVPQRRSRLILTASRHGRPGIPAPTYGPGQNPYLTVWDAIGQYPPLQAGEAHDQVPNHAAPSLSPITKARLRFTPEGGGRRDWPEHLMLDCHVDHDGHSDVYGRLHRARPSGTLTTRCISVSNGRFAHPTQDRSITPREAAVSVKAVAARIS